MVLSLAADADEGTQLFSPRRIQSRELVEALDKVAPR